MAEIKSKETLLAELKVFLKAFNRYLDTSDNSLIKDIILTPYSIGGAAVMNQVEIARDLGILSRLTSSDLDNEGTNYGKERLPGAYATVTLTFFTESTPTTDIVIPAATQAQTTGTTFTSPVSFSTVSEARFGIGGISSYYSFDRARYEFPVTALCDSIGTVGNVGNETITGIIGAVSGIQGVVNLSAATGGSDEELDDYRERIRTTMTGRDLNTVNGLRAFIKDSGFVDAYPIRVEDYDSERSAGIDAFVMTDDATAATDNFTYDPSQQRYYFTHRPIVGVTSVVASIVGTLPATKYDVNEDSTTELRRSIYAQDYITFHMDAGLHLGETLIISYNYDSAIEQIQGQLNLNTNDVLTADPIVKRGFPLQLFINATLTLKANADGPETRNKIRNALSQYCSRFRLGSVVQKSDFVIVLQKGYGDYPVDSVDAVVITSMYVMDEEGNRTTMGPSEVITVENKQYVVFGGATLI